jgi:hypothetical protein
LDGSVNREWLYDVKAIPNEVIHHLFLKWPEVEKDFSLVYVHNLDVVADEVNRIVIALLVLFDLLEGQGDVYAFTLELLVVEVTY